ncbi:MAG: glycoside hydrolase family 88 protein, partial [Phaeodactylibacter sp.]|nr:glycoside hydrolase family 88 protein [Phaeodactylibacter sp.]
MNRSTQLICLTACLSLLFVVCAIPGNAQPIPDKQAVVEQMRLANAYFMKKWPDVGKPIVTNKERASNIWTRGVYYEGLMALYEIDPQPEYYDYAVRWAEFHNWDLRDGDTYTRNADN